ncbi:MAG: bifunctional diaminohydroxyphosphoribosylaminopyrimidine deaminase/5-amino-6-(5-phosphoribosylamino)uracil reductase RibD [Verrucomicrobia bacterium]|nr:bifunctional diaminohydroxyphosphoribosylaminopyrimidine deaminase/5-amino-6-(5-phosphoribosylamino)uracil reductase RibD [Verrucomicrobiota bacterium]
MTDAEWMAMALEEAWKGVGKTAPNPPVGAVITKDGALLGKGWHSKAGAPHAEVKAMADAEKHHGREALRGATAFVSLEPCSTAGRTPACTGGLVEAGISRVIYGSMDPNPAHAGAADAVLKAAGIEVKSGVLRDQCDEILRPFSKVQRTGLPWVIWKCAMSLDGKITRPEGEGQWLSGVESRADVQLLRSQVDAIVTSGETVRRDLPALTIRVPEFLEGREQPWRVVVTDKPETMPKKAAIFSDEWKHRTLIRSRKNPEEMLRALAEEQGILSVMLEAGGNFSAAMISAGLVDEVVIYYAPILCGNTVPALAGEGFPASVALEGISRETFGKDLRVRGLVAK